MLRRIDGRSLQTWFRETGHDSMAQLILSLPDDIVVRLRQSAPRALWQRWIESAEYVGAAPFGAASHVAEALIALDRLERRGEIVVVEEGEKFVRPSRISATKWKVLRANEARESALRAQSAVLIQRMKSLL
jgi:hypothetical protein